MTGTRTPGVSAGPEASLALANDELATLRSDKQMLQDLVLDQRSTLARVEDQVVRAQALAGHLAHCLAFAEGTEETHVHLAAIVHETLREAYAILRPETGAAAGVGA